MIINKLKAYGICILVMLYHWIAGKIMYYLVDKDIELLAIVFPIPMAVVSIVIAGVCFELASIEFDGEGSGYVSIIAGIYTIINSALLIIYYYYTYG